MTKRIIAVLLTAVFIFSLFGCTRVEPPEILQPKPNTTDDASVSITDTPENGYAVSTSSKLASEVGAKVLEAGGNAVDAAIAVGYTMSVVEPYASGIGGGGGMLVYDPKTDKYTFINYMPEAARSGATSYNIGVPGFVSGMQTASDKFGTKDYSELLKYAYDYAQNGFEVNEKLEYRISQGGSDLNGTPLAYAEEGDTVVQPQVAETIKTIIEKGSDDFYNGSIAEKIAEKTPLKKSDLAAYKAIVTDAVTGSFGGYTIASAPSPYSGVQLIQMLKLMDMNKVPSPKENASAYFDSFIKIKLATGADRVSFSCDPAFSKKNQEYASHLSDEYLKNLLSAGSSSYKEEEESEDTTHISIIDKDGMTVSMTNTLSSFWGSHKSVNGFFINNSLRNFSNGINACEPGKRGRTFISPTIIADETSDSIFAIGTPGGNVITTILAEVIADICLYGDEPHDAINKMRFTVNSENSLTVETGLKTDLIADPHSTNYYQITSNRNEYFGSVNLAGYDAENEKFYAVADLRRTGSGYSK